MQFLLMIYQAEGQLAAMSADEGQSMAKAYDVYTQSIVKSGHLRAGDALQPTRTAKTVRLKNGKVATTDGPFAETKEQLGGYYLVEAADIEEAISLAGRIPSVALGGSVEVRPVRAMPRPG